MNLVAFDFDGTLSDSEMTVLLGEREGVADEMATITERAMNDEIEYATSLRERAALLDGLSETDVQQAFDQVRLREGAADLITTLRTAGIRVSILTGGFERGVQTALDHADTAVDSIVANRLPIDAGSLTGSVEGPLIEGTKDEALCDLTDEFGTDPDNVIAVGDGANDLPMLAFAGCAVGYDPKPAVEATCDVTVTSMADLYDVFVEHGLLSV